MNEKVPIKHYHSRELVQMVKKAGWHLERVSGDDHIFKHKYKSGIVTIPHPKSSFPIKTIINILRQSGLR